MPLDLAAIKARLAAATPGPWRQQLCACGSDCDDHASVKAGGSLVVTCAPDADADLIAHAPQDLAALIAEVERLRAVLDSSSSALTEIAEDIRRELWLDEQDFRGHKLYDRIMDALPALDGGEVSGG